MTTINRTPMVDDDGSGTTGTILNNAWKQELYDQIDAALASLLGPHNILSAAHLDTIAAALIAGDVLYVGAAGKLTRLAKGTDGTVLTIVSGAPSWAAPSGGGGSTPHNILSATHPDTIAGTLVAGDVLYVDGAGKLTRLAKGADGTVLTLASGVPSWAAPTGGGGSTPHNILSATHPDTLAAALVAGDVLYVGADGKLTRLAKATDGQVLTLAGGAPSWATPAGAGGLGIWTKPAFNAANFTVSPGSWTVEAGDVASLQYMVIGKTVYVIFDIMTTTLSMNPSSLWIALPPAIMPALETRQTCQVINAGALSNTPGFSRVAPGVARLEIWRDYTGTQWTPSTNGVGMRGQIFYEMQ